MVLVFMDKTTISYNTKGILYRIISKISQKIDERYDYL